MRKTSVPKAILAVPAAASAAAMSATPSIGQMRHQRRVIIVAAPRGDDPRLALQRRTLSQWKTGAEERDVAVVAVVGKATSGASDDTGLLRQKHHLPDDRFMVVLLGKDGHEALRSPRPIAARELAGKIDAMPMRRAGQR
jgi:hypothetical protein